VREGGGEGGEGAAGRQVNPTARLAFDILDDIFTGIFVMELLLTIIAYWFFPFFQSAWRVFDLIAVTGSLVSAIEANVPAFHPLRAIRVIRVIRLLGKEGSLKQITQAMIESIVPVLNSLVLLGLVTCIFATMGVGFFGNQEPILFGTFSASFFSMFQACTGDAWASGITRTMFDNENEGRIKPLPAIFFMLYMVIAYIMLFNIVVAVLLDNFLTTMTKGRERQRKSEMVMAEHNSLDPVVEVLAQFRSSADLNLSVKSLFRRLDVDMSGAIGFAEFRDGLRKLLDAHISLEDWEDATERYVSSP